MTLYSLLHGPEAWLALAIWGVGAFCGVAAAWAAVEIGERREERRESAASDLDHTGKRGSGAAPRGAADRGGGRG